MRRPAPSSRPNLRCSVVELRRYLLHPGARETLIELFDREFVETQEAVGIEVIAQFRDLDEPDVFTWLRGFPDMESRAASLAAFYDGPVWARFRDAANATMVDSDNVWLLRPTRPGVELRLPPRRLPRGATGLLPGLVVATAYTLRDDPAAFAHFFAEVVAPRVTAHGAMPVATFETEPSPNTFPRLPVREGERAFVWFARFDHQSGYRDHVARREADPVWSSTVMPALADRLAAPPQVMRLTPTARSRAFTPEPD